MRTFGILLGGMVIGAVAVWFCLHVDWHIVASSWKNSIGKKAEHATTTSQTTSSTTAVQPAPEKKAVPVEVKPYPGISWDLAEIGVDAMSVPVYSVNVKTASQTYLVGNFSGKCFEIAGSGWSLVDGEKSGVICWWAGGGTEIGVFSEGSKMVVKVGDIEEGSADVPGARELNAKAKTLEPLFEIQL